MIQFKFENEWKYLNLKNSWIWIPITWLDTTFDFALHNYGKKKGRLDHITLTLTFFNFKFKIRIGAGEKIDEIY